MLFIILILLGVGLLFFGARSMQTTAKLIGFIGGAIMLLLGASQAVTVVPAGSVAVVDVFGNVSSTTLKPGINIVNPFADVVHFSVKTQEIKEAAEVPSKEGLTVQLELSVLYHLNPDEADDVYRTLGEDYADILLVPFFRSVTRGVTAEYEAKALYTSEREELAQRIQTELSRKVAPRGIVIEGTPLRKIALPAKVTDAIEDKLKAEQESQRMQFVLTKEKQEAERKRVEAQGVADFQRIVSEGINDNLLKWKGIEATEELARSNNSKVVVIGSGQNGLPLILGGQ
jgi:regulator of protease activity HflC (stomatin/prohibitin superfamily)